MLSLEKEHARLEISAKDDFGHVVESIRMLLQLCRINGLRSALIVSHQSATDWRSSLRIGIKFCASRGVMPDCKLALVVHGAQPLQRDDVCQVAHEAGLACRVLESEDAALTWLKEAGPNVQPQSAS
jgi:hypothetical protein